MTTKWHLCDYTDEKGSYEIYEGDTLRDARLICELINCAPADAERIVTDHNSRDELVAATEHALDAVKKYPTVHPMTASEVVMRNALKSAGIEL